VPVPATPTLVSSLLADVRLILNETTAGYWTDQELLNHMYRGAVDLWRKINGEYREYFITQNATDVTLAANTASLSGLPGDCYRVTAILPRVLGPDNPNKSLIFKPRKYTHPDFQTALAGGPVHPYNAIIFYDVQTQGAPVAAPVILVAPQVLSEVLLQITYNQYLSNVAFQAPGTSTYNPIPGGADNALIAWTVAWARAKEGPDPSQRMPDPNWLAVYKTEKDNLIAELSTPRSEQEEEVVHGVFEDQWPDWNGPN
jgi:hypothetical protein